MLNHKLLILTFLVFVGGFLLQAGYSAISSQYLLQPTPVASATPTPVPNNCVKGGCSGQLCIDPESERGISTCEWREEYACYQTANCERQSDGKCGFTMDARLTSCLGKTRNRLILPK